jgi:ABC-2 type transport system permease protein
MVVMMSLVWLGVVKDNPNLPLSPRETVSYFFIGAMLYSLSNFHTTYIEEDIKLGFLTKYFLRPISPFFYYLSYQSSRAVIETILKTCIIIPILLLLGYQLSYQIPNLLLFIAFMPVIFLFSFNVLMMISTTSFWITEAYSFRWGITIIMRFLAGLLVPISFFSTQIQSVLYFLPFEHLAYTPIQLLLENLTFQEGVQALLILSGWTVVMNLARYALWKKGTVQYEGTGI